MCKQRAKGVEKLGSTNHRFLTNIKLSVKTSENYSEPFTNKQGFYTIFNQVFKLFTKNFSANFNRGDLTPSAVTFSTTNNHHYQY